jgi:N-acetylglutamate synthase-like GNAT family acetyltransferase
MTIKQMTDNDLPAVTDLYVDANQFAKKKDILIWTKRGLTKFPKLDLVCEKNEKIIGAISAIRTRNNAAIINDIAVLKKYRSHHIGKKLMQAILLELKKEKIKRIELWVHWKNSRAIPFYYQFGFHLKRITRTKGVEGVPDGEDIVQMEKTF